MLISFIFSYSENYFVVLYLSFYFVLGQDPSARDRATGKGRARGREGHSGKGAQKRPR